MDIFYKTSKLILIVLVVSLTLAIVTDIIFLFMYREEIRTDIYLAGNYVSTIAQDPSVLSTGTTKWGTPVYSNEDLLKQLRTYADASYGHRAKSTPTQVKSGNRIDLSYIIDTGLLDEIIVTGEVIEQDGMKGMRITIMFLAEPRGKSFGFQDTPINIPRHKVHLTRVFRVI